MLLRENDIASSLVDETCVVVLDVVDGSTRVPEP